MPSYRQNGSSRKSLRKALSARLSDRFYICRRVTCGEGNDFKRNNDTERIYLKKSLKIPY